jgi:hypothetical protein
MADDEALSDTTLSSESSLSLLASDTELSSSSPAKKQRERVKVANRKSSPGTVSQMDGDSSDTELSDYDAEEYGNKKRGKGRGGKSTPGRGGRAHKTQRSTPTTGRATGSGAIPMPTAHVVR